MNKKDLSIARSLKRLVQQRISLLDVGKRVSMNQFHLKLTSLTMKTFSGIVSP
jgi:ribosomal protein S15P/S13E